MGRTFCVQKLLWKSETIPVHNMFSPGFSLEFSCNCTCNSMNNMSSYCWCKNKSFWQKIYLYRLFILHFVYVFLGCSFLYKTRRKPQLSRLLFPNEWWVFQSDVLQRKNVDFADEEKYFTQYVLILLHISQKRATEREPT